MAKKDNGRPPLETRDPNRRSDPVDKKRRDLAKAGLSAPVLMTLASRPAFAKQCTASILASGNLSNPVDTTTCGACTDRQWSLAKSPDWNNCGIVDPTTTALNVVFPSIPTIATGSGAVPIIEGSLMDTLQGLCIIPSELKFVDSQNKIISPQSDGRKVLGSLMRCALTLVLNGLHPATSMNIGYEPGQIVNDVHMVLVVLGKHDIDYDQLVMAEQNCLTLMSDGSSCALS